MYSRREVWLTDKVSRSCYCQCLSYPSAYVVYSMYVHMYVYICMYVSTRTVCLLQEVYVVYAG